MPEHRRRRMAARAILAVFAAAMLAACAIRIEPPQDTRIVAELEALTLGTQTLFAPGDGFAVERRTERAQRYSGLAARAAAIRLLAEARPTPSSPVSDRIRAAFAPSDGRIAELIGRAPDGASGGDLSNATSGFMSDYLGALERLRGRDEAAPSDEPPASIIKIAHLAMEDALRDALFYERSVLNRNR